LRHKELLAGLIEKEMQGYDSNSFRWCRAWRKRVRLLHYTLAAICRRE
jgi:hypothetical protein